MITYYKVKIDETSEREVEEKNGDINTTSQLFNTETEKFKTLEEAKDWIKERYSNVKLITSDDENEGGIYIDTKDGTTIKIGNTYKYLNKDYSHDSEEWLQVDWLTISKVTEEAVLI